MFPFKCYPTICRTKLSEQEFKSRIGIVANQSKIKIKSGWVIKKPRKQNTIVLEYKQTFYRNNFRPVVVCSWETEQHKAIVHAHLRLSYVTIFLCFTPFIFGLYISYEIRSFLPLIIALIVSCCIIFIFGYALFLIDKKWILEEFKKLIS